MPDESVGRWALSSIRGPVGIHRTRVRRSTKRALESPCLVLCSAGLDAPKILLDGYGQSPSGFGVEPDILSLRPSRGCRCRKKDRQNSVRQIGGYFGNGTRDHAALESRRRAGPQQSGILDAAPRPKTLHLRLPETDAHRVFVETKFHRRCRRRFNTAYTSRQTYRLQTRKNTGVSLGICRRSRFAPVPLPPTGSPSGRHTFLSEAGEPPRRKTHSWRKPCRAGCGPTPRSRCRGPRKDP
jgi:hypothetical protein